MAVDGYCHALTTLSPEKRAGTLVQEVRWAPETVLTGVENLAPTEFDPLAVHTIVSSYTDDAILAHTN
jgi:hypothetical protein